jgi:glycosyltransferase involved in cell wall biosynthesis
VRALHFNTNKDFGGGERQIVALLQRSSRHGAEAELLVTMPSALADFAADANIPWSRVARRIPYDPFAIRNIAALLRERKIDVLHAHDGKAASLGVFAANKANIPAVIHRRIASPLRNNWLTRKKYDPARVARYVAVSKTVAGVLRSYGAPDDKIRVVASGVDVAKLAAFERGAARALLPESRRGASPLLGTVAKLAPKKGVDIVLRAFATIHASIATSQLIVVGAGPERAGLEALARNLGIAEFVTFAGARPEGARLMADFDVLLFASELEGSPGVLREAMALRVPIVTVDTPGCVEVAGETASIVARGDAPALAAAALEIWNHPARRASLTAAAFDRVERNFSLDAMVAATIAVDREIT